MTCTPKCHHLIALMKRNALENLSRTGECSASLQTCVLSLVGPKLKGGGLLPGVSGSVPYPAASQSFPLH